EELSVHTSFYKGIWTDKTALFEHLDSHSIEKALLVYPSTDAHLQLESHKEVCRIYNAAAAKMMQEYSAIAAAGIIDLSRADTIFTQVEELKKRGFRAISLASSYAGTFIIEKVKTLLVSAEEHDLLIFVHPQTINPIGFSRVKDPLLAPVLEYSFDISMFLGLLMMEGLIEKHGVTFIFSSLGGVVPFLKDRFDRVYAMLRKRQLVKDLGAPPSQILKNVYVDTSGSSLKNVELAIDLFGEDKIVWGSDYPVNMDVKENLQMFDSLAPDLREKIIHKNFASLLK
ncbi:amidohydrolase family protein, partial [Candidatus Omnitrophota bacterium]